MKKILFDYVKELGDETFHSRYVKLRKQNMEQNHYIELFALPELIIDNELNRHILYSNYRYVTCNLKIICNVTKLSSVLPYKPSYEELFITEWEEIK
jgi:hypothetical protein